MFIRCVCSAWCKGHRDVPSRLSYCTLNRCDTRENDQVRLEIFPVSPLRVIELSLNRLEELVSTLPSCAGWLTAQSFLGPQPHVLVGSTARMSDFRKVEADAQATEMSSETVASILKSFP